MTTLYVQTTQAATRMLDLYNGTDNIGAPANWDQPSFDDSGWVLSAVQPTLAQENSHWSVRTYGSPSYTIVFDDNVNTSGVLEGTRVWPQSTPRITGQQCLFRFHATIPSGFTLQQAEFWTPAGQTDIIDVDFRLNGSASAGAWSGGWTALQTYINGHVLPGQDNLIAIWIERGHVYQLSTGGGAAEQNWSTTAWLMFRLTFDVVGGARSFGTIL